MTSVLTERYPPAFAQASHSDVFNLKIQFILKPEARPQIAPQCVDEKRCY